MGSFPACCQGTSATTRLNLERGSYTRTRIGQVVPVPDQAGCLRFSRVTHILRMKTLTGDLADPDRHRTIRIRRPCRWRHLTETF